MAYLNESDLITFDEVSEMSISANNTNPFRNLSNNTFASSSLLDIPIGENTTSTPLHGTNISNKNEFDQKLDKLINCFTKIASNTSDSSHKDIRHIDSFNGEGSELNVLSKLNIFIRDFDDFFCERNILDRDKICLVRQKLSGSAKSLINSSSPLTYNDIKYILFDAFGNVGMSQEDLLAELRNIKMRDNESFRQFSIRTLDLSGVVAHKLECLVNDKIVFEAFSKALLTKFQSYVYIQSQIKQAIKNRSPNLLIRELCDLIELDNTVFIKNEKKLNVKHNINKSVNLASGVRDIVTCGHCFRTGHVVKDCFYLKNMKCNFRNNRQNF